MIWPFKDRKVLLRYSQKKLPLKSSFSEKATKMSAIVLVLKFTSLVNGKTIKTIEQIFVAFSEKLNFIKFRFSKMFYMFFLQVHFQFYIFFFVWTTRRIILHLFELRKFSF